MFNSILNSTFRMLAFSTAFLLMVVLTTSCGSGGGSSLVNIWAWISGSNTIEQSGYYGTKGTTDSANIPGARHGSISWNDADGNQWLFGGTGYDSSGTEDSLNDLWRWDGTNWTWISGSDTVNESGTYGTKGTAHTDNIPGARSQAINWIDTNGYFWLFSGT